MKIRILLISLHCFFATSFAQNYTFNFATNGRRVCLVDATVNLVTPSVTINFLDATNNTNEPISIYRRQLNTTAWFLVANNILPGTTSWTDNNVAIGDVWEYQIRRANTWTYNSLTYDAIGYTIGCIAKDQSDYLGQMILIVANDVVSNASIKYQRLKSQIANDGWKVNELVVNRASNWDSGNEVVAIKNQITTIYNNAPANDKPKVIFILGHVPLPRSGSTTVTAPDEHDENKGARGSDAYYADIDGNYTDIATYNPGGLATPLAINLPNDYKWDQDFFPSNIEMAFGRVDFADITDYSSTELQLLENYMDRLTNYKYVAPSFNMGNKTGFYFGYDNSNDGSYRSLPNISKSSNVYQNYLGATHPQWVANNGPFKMYMQNLLVPDINEWNTYGMNATVFSSDQSYWGFGDVPQNFSIYSRIRSLLGANTKCLVTLWTTTGINIFHRACTGEPFGISVKDIMNHNSTNQKLEKAPQEYDTENWWNRTHFAFFGDPTIRLYQVIPPSNLTLIKVNNTAFMQWVASPDPEVIAYSIYESNSEFGAYNKIADLPINTTSYTIPNYQFGNWYSVKAIKLEESGCGKFINPSIGINTQGSIVLSLQKIRLNANTVQQKVKLTWQTNTEAMTKNFVIERSSNSINWENIAIINAAGNSGIAKEYVHFDDYPLQYRSFYRVKVTNLDGKISYTNITSVYLNPNGIQLNVSPNPTSNNLNINAGYNINTIVILNIEGKVIYTFDKINKNNFNVKLADLSKGIYLAKIIGSNFNTTQKFIKQ